MWNYCVSKVYAERLSKKNSFNAVIGKLSQEFPAPTNRIFILYYTHRIIIFFIAITILSSSCRGDCTNALNLKHDKAIKITSWLLWLQNTQYAKSKSLIIRISQVISATEPSVFRAAEDFDICAVISRSASWYKYSQLTSEFRSTWKMLKKCELSPDLYPCLLSEDSNLTWTREFSVSDETWTYCDKWLW